MNDPQKTAAETMEQQVITPEQLLAHWQGHRNLTRKVIEAFPENKLFTYSLGGMRPFSELALEMINMAIPGIHGVATREWKMITDFSTASADKPTTKQQLLDKWDEATTIINELWQQIPPNRFQEEDNAFGQYKGRVHWIFMYFVDNEIHHRGQGYVYLRSLDIEPPFFWDRD